MNVVLLELELNIRLSVLSILDPLLMSLLSWLCYDADCRVEKGQALDFLKQVFHWICSFYHFDIETRFGWEDLSWESYYYTCILLELK